VLPFAASNNQSDNSDVDDGSVNYQNHFESTIDEINQSTNYSLPAKPLSPLIRSPAPLQSAAPTLSAVIPATPLAASTLVRTPTKRKRGKRIQNEDTHVNIKPLNHSHTASFDPEEFRDTFDIINELTCRRDLYCSDRSDIPTTIYNVPSYLRIILNRLSARVPVLPKPTLSVTACCTLARGLEILSDIPCLQDNLEIQDRFDFVDWLPVDYLDQISTWFKTFPFKINTFGGGEEPKLQLRFLPSQVSTLASLKNKIGIPMSPIAITAMQFALLEVDCISEYHPRLSESTLVFKSALAIRSDMSDVLMSALHSEMVDEVKPVQSTEE